MKRSLSKHHTRQTLGVSSSQSTLEGIQAPATLLGANIEDKYKSRSIQSLLSLKERVTVITGKTRRCFHPDYNLTTAGGARGIGLALARGAAELGSDVAVLDVLEKPSDEFFEFEAELGVRAKYYRYVDIQIQRSIH